MKLVYFFLYVNIFIYASGEKEQQGQFSFPQKYPFTNSRVASDSSIYFPSEFQTLNPYFASNNYDDTYKFSLPIQAKLSNTFPTSFPILLTPTTDHKDEKSPRRTEGNEKFNKSVPTPFTQNQTKIISNNKEAERRKFPIDLRIINHKQPIDRMDTKASAQISPHTEATKPLYTNYASQKFIISAENGKNQDLGQEASNHNMQMVPHPNFYVQSTTETAIPILRLSNEMDLDGSFSYEALGADQTHYVQHSHMENLGTDKEGQVVEGSYSYVGDDGQTYTVHYIADSNGYRATGDHLPVAPPVPEIIQRSIQYNLAEDAKKPPHLRYYYENESDSILTSDKNGQNYVPMQNNLFTGRTPEAFSFGLSQRTALQKDLAPLSSSTELNNQNIVFSEDKLKKNTNYETLEPQITFLASQGASLPLNKPQKSALLQVVNYETSQAKPSTKESENAKALWRWQYGSNTNTENLNPIKNLISRSSSEGDEVIINFNEMTPAEYSKAIRNYENSLTMSNHDLILDQQTKPNHSNYLNYNKIMNSNNSFENKNYYDINNDNDINTAIISGSEPAFSQLNNEHENFDNVSNTHTQISKSQEIFEINNPLSFAPSTETPQWFDYESVSYKPKGLDLYPTDKKNKDSRYENMTNTSESSNHNSHNNGKYKVNLNNERISSSTANPLDYNNIIQNQKNNELHIQDLPMLAKRQEIIIQNNNEKEVSTTEDNINDMIRNNIFLRNLFKTRSPDKLQNYLQNEPRIESNSNTVINTSTKSGKNEPKYVTVATPKSIGNEPTPLNEIKFIEKKPLDMSDVLNYVINKNVFESNKLKVTRRPQHINNDNKQFGFHTDPNYDLINKESKVDPQVHFQNNLRFQPQQQEIRGILKNYKVIQRNNVKKSNMEQENNSQNVHEVKNQNIYLKLPHLGRAGPSTKSYLPPIYL